MNDEHEKLRRMIVSGGKTKQDFAPYYMQQDIEPPSGGSSLLHDEHGRPLHKKGPPVANRNLPVGEPPPVEYVQIKGTRPEETHPARPLQSRTLNPTHTAANPSPAQERFEPLVYEEQGNISVEEAALSLNEARERDTSPAPSTNHVQGSYNDNPNTGIPVHVGNHDDHVWHDKNVTGATIDNNEYVNTDALQGTQRLPENDADRARLEEKQSSATWSKDNPPRPVISDVVSGLSQEEMCVLIKGDPIYVSSDVSKITTCVEDAMTKYQIPIADITVIKRMGLNFGLKMK